jgi:MSHA biogenesis protein MshN
MSVINQALKDLASRFGETPSNGNEGLANTGIQEKIITRMPVWKLTLGVLVMVGVATQVVIWWKKHHKDLYNLQAQVMEVKKQTALTSPSGSKEAEKNLKVSNGSVSGATSTSVDQKSNFPIVSEFTAEVPSSATPMAVSTTQPVSLDTTVRTTTPEQALQQQYRQILNLLQDEKLQNAQQSLETFVEEHPNFEPAVYSLISLYLDEQHFDAAEKLITASKERMGYTTDLKMYQAQLLLDREQPAEALELLTQRLPDMKTHVEYYTLLAGLYLKVGNFFSAEQYYQQLLTIDASRSLWWLGLGESYYAQKRYQEAKNAYREALDYNNSPSSVRVYIVNQLKLLE